MIADQDQVSQLHPQQQSNTGLWSAATLVDDCCVHLSRLDAMLKKFKFVAAAYMA